MVVVSGILPFLKWTSRIESTILQSSWGLHNWFVPWFTVTGVQYLAAVFCKFSQSPRMNWKYQGHLFRNINQMITQLSKNIPGINI